LSAQRKSKGRASARAAVPKASERGARPAPRLALAWYSVLPLFALYEGALFAGGRARNTSELLVTSALAGLGSYEQAARIALLVALSAWAGYELWRARVPVFPGALRPPFEGALCALALGPLLAAVFALLPEVAPEVRELARAPREAPGLARMALLAGGSVWEELVFRLGAYSLIALCALRSARFLGLPPTSAGLLADGCALALSSLAFAAFHLRAFNAWLGSGGEPYDPSAFWWRFLAGASLALVFRWRGLGAAAWCHALFNAALALGSGARVLL